MSLQRLAIRLPTLSEVMGAMGGFFIVLTAAILAFVLPLEAAAAAFDLENGIYTKRQDTMQWCCVPGCVYCLATDCFRESCDFPFTVCCAEGLRQDAFEDISDFEVFNEDGTEIQFVG
ncbi:hypothetical protein DL770_008303 [Monosporascus sp. CRB-9-2]|nr:hypothetical protein DL770_008303 [Monosporascus sp. CRB-9-2]